MTIKKSNIEYITTFKTPDNSPGYLLWRVSTQWRGTIEDTLKAFDLTHPQFVILAVTAWLTRTNQKISQIDISKVSGLDPNTTSQILRGLESKKLIKRTRSLNERSKNPHLTTMGSDLLSTALPAVEKADALFFSSLPSNQTTLLINFFKILIK